MEEIEEIKKKEFAQLRARIEPLDDAGRDKVLYWAAALWEDREFYKGRYKESLKRNWRDAIMEWFFPISFVVIIPLFMAFAIYSGVTAIDYDRANFMLECQHMHEFSEEKCEEILKGK